MSQEQRRRPDQGWGQGQDVAIRYGDVFPVTGDLADRPVAPTDAAMMQSAESTVFGQTMKGGAAAAMESTTARNEQRRAVGHNQVSDIPRDQGVTVTETDIPGQPGHRLVTEYVAGRAVKQYVINMGVGVGGMVGGGNQGGFAGVLAPGDKITIGEALEATAWTAGDKPVEPSDAAAIQEAESTATGVKKVLPGGVAAAVQAAVIANDWADVEEDKTNIGDVLADATAGIPADKEVTRREAERVAGAEIRNNPNLDTRPGGVATTMAAAARLNEPKR